MRIVLLLSQIMGRHFIGGRRPCYELQPVHLCALYRPVVPYTVYLKASGSTTYATAVVLFPTLVVSEHGTLVFISCKTV